MTSGYNTAFSSMFNPTLVIHVTVLGSYRDGTSLPPTFIDQGRVRGAVWGDLNDTNIFLQARKAYPRTPDNSASQCLEMMRSEHK
jgi:hypothetical protein